MATKTVREVIHIRHALSDVQAAELEQLIDKHVNTAIAHSWAGSGDPSEETILEMEAEVAHYIANLVKAGK